MQAVCEELRVQYQIKLHSARRGFPKTARMNSLYRFHVSVHRGLHIIYILIDRTSKGPGLVIPEERPGCLQEGRNACQIWVSTQFRTGQTAGSVAAVFLLLLCFSAPSPLARGDDPGTVSDQLLSSVTERKS